MSKIGKIFVAGLASRPERAQPFPVAATHPVVEAPDIQEPTVNTSQEPPNPTTTPPVTPDITPQSSPTRYASRPFVYIL